MAAHKYNPDDNGFARPPTLDLTTRVPKQSNATDFAFEAYGARGAIRPRFRICIGAGSFSEDRRVKRITVSGTSAVNRIHGNLATDLLKDELTFALQCR